MRPIWSKATDEVSGAKCYLPFKIIAFFFLDETVGVGGGAMQGDPMVVGNEVDVHDRRLDTGILMLVLTIVFGLYIRLVDAVFFLFIETAQFNAKSFTL